MTPIKILPAWPEAIPTPGVDVRCLSEVERRHAYARRWVDGRMRGRALVVFAANVGSAMSALAAVARGAGPGLAQLVRLIQDVELDAEVEQMWDHEIHAPAPPCVDPTSPF